MKSPVLVSTCATCGCPIGWVNCPTGGWWAHLHHPEDDHDAEVPCGDPWLMRALEEIDQANAYETF